jgi:hypothetical protein
VNCTRAQVLLATHRELNTDDVETVALDAHLEQCASCRHALARYSLLGEQLRSLPALEPSPEMYSNLMQALAAEHSQFIRRSSSLALPPPEFLKPYLREHAHSSAKTDPLAAFSSADTGPLPIIQAVRKKRRHSSLGQFTAIGLAAVFLMTLMMGGITSLLLLAHDGQVSNAPAQLVVNRPAQVVKVSYTTTTVYNHVVSAVADQTSIYYSAYGDGNNSNWMLEQLDRTTKISTPLLATSNASPLIVLGSANGWLAWLQFDTPKITTRAVLPDHLTHPLIRTWSLHYISLVGPVGRDTTAPNQPVTLLSGTFVQDATLSWIHSPIQGIWFTQNTLLVAMVDENGVSHLVSYPLGENNVVAATEIAQAGPDHILTSPTANNDGTQIFWAEEWRSDDQNLHSNIWTQQVINAPMPLHGQAIMHSMTIKQLFLQDGLSFTPLVVNDALFLISTASGTSLTQATPNTTPLPASTSTPLPSATPNTSTPPATSWANTNFYSAALDSSVRGNVVMYPLADSANVSPIQVAAAASASSIQAGTNFVLWQNSDGSYGMYDAVIKSSITVGDVLNDAQFLAVNGDTAVWTINNTGATGGNAIPSTILEAFSWPMN